MKIRSTVLAYEILLSSSLSSRGAFETLHGQREGLDHAEHAIFALADERTLQGP